MTTQGPPAGGGTVVGVVGRRRPGPGCDDTRGLVRSPIRGARDESAATHPKET